jgi:hypothetical protein
MTLVKYKYSGWAFGQTLFALKGQSHGKVIEIAPQGISIGPSLEQLF